VGVTPSVPVKANSGVRARVPAAGKVLEGDDKPTLLREDQHYLHYITIYKQVQLTFDNLTPASINQKLELSEKFTKCINSCH